MPLKPFLSQKKAGQLPAQIAFAAKVQLYFDVASVGGLAFDLDLSFLYRVSHGLCPTTDVLFNHDFFDSSRPFFNNGLLTTFNDFEIAALHVSWRDGPVIGDWPALDGNGFFLKLHLALNWAFDDMGTNAAGIFQGAFSDGEFFIDDRNNGSPLAGREAREEAHSDKHEADVPIDALIPQRKDTLELYRRLRQDV